jgi:hypothetical protein
LLAEIHNKVNANGSNLTDRLEDQLTGDFFGALRYLPFEIGMKSILSTVRFENDKITQEWNSMLQVEKGFMQEMKFWYRHTDYDKNKDFYFSLLILDEVCSNKGKKLIDTYRNDLQSMYQYFPHRNDKLQNFKGVTL